MNRGLLGFPPGPGLGKIGEARITTGDGTGKICTISSGTPAIVSVAGHGWSVCQPLDFTTSGGSPDSLAIGISAGTQYWISSAGYGPDAFQIAASAPDALDGINSIATSSVGSGTTTANNRRLIPVSGTTYDVCGIVLPPGDWDVAARGAFDPAATTVTLHPSLFTISPTSAVHFLSDLTRAMSIPLPEAGEIGGGGFNAPLIPCRILLAVQTKLYLTASATFTTSTIIAFGCMVCRRAAGDP